MARNRTISISQEHYNQLRRFGYAGQSLNVAIGKLLAIVVERVQMSNSPLVQECSTASVARTVIDYIDEVKNSRIEAVSSGRLKTLIQTLVDISNFRLLQGFLIDVIYIPIDDIRFEIGSSYHPELKF